MDKHGVHMHIQARAPGHHAANILDERDFMLIVIILCFFGYFHKQLTLMGQFWPKSKAIGCYTSDLTLIYFALLIHFLIPLIFSFLHSYFNSIIT